jgi:hypothetical protein
MDVKLILEIDGEQVEVWQDLDCEDDVPEQRHIVAAIWQYVHQHESANEIIVIDLGSVSMADLHNVIEDATS